MIPSPFTLRSDLRSRFAGAPLYVKDLVERFESSPDRIYYTDDYPEIVSYPTIATPHQTVGHHRVEVKARLIPAKRIAIKSLIGVGDAMWTRGIVRAHLDAGFEVSLQTKFPWAFWDIPAAKIGVLPKGVPVRHASYIGLDLKGGMTVYEGMRARCHVPPTDFKLPIHPDWSAKAGEWLMRWPRDKPLAIVRPLVANRDRKSVTARNPDPTAYLEIFSAVKDQFFTVSVASGADNEVITTALPADMQYHNGEIPLPVLMAIMAQADLVYTNPGMALVTAAAVGAPVCAVFGGYEDAHNYQDTVAYGPSLLIDTIKPCRCMSDAHSCDKRVDIPAAIAKLSDYVKRNQSKEGESQVIPP